LRPYFKNQEGRGRERKKKKKGPVSAVLYRHRAEEKKRHTENATYPHAVLKGRRKKKVD